MREPPYRFYMMESVKPAAAYANRPGRWIGEEAWPSSHTTDRRFAINAGSLDAEATPEQSLELASPQSTGLASGEWGSFAISGDIPGHQSLDSFGSLEFDSEPLSERLEMLGNAEVILELAADRPDALVAARVIDVAPDGAATAVARGFLNLTHRDSREEPTPLVPGKRYRVKVQLGGTGYSFPTGHRIRLAISNAYWPIVWPSPELVTLTLFTGASQLLLPIRQQQRNDAELPSLPEPVASPPSPMTILRKGRIERSVTIDQITGGVSHRLFIDGGVFGDWGKFRLDDIGLEMGHVYERVYSIRPDDPNSAKASMTQSYEMGRGDWQVKIDAGAEMTSTPTSFELNAWVEAFEGNAPVCRRDWKSSVKRKRL